MFFQVQTVWASQQYGLDATPSVENQQVQKNLMVFKQLQDIEKQSEI